jgi:NTE family protein
MEPHPMTDRRIPLTVSTGALLAGLTFTLPSGAQTPPPATPPARPAVEVAAGTSAPGVPRIGLALSGGGARGLAHVGVLKVLEEMRIPISCVTGTSMGAIVGGTYASGRSPAEMEKVVVAADWEDIFRVHRRARKLRCAASSTITRRCSSRSSASRMAA